MATILEFRASNVVVPKVRNRNSRCSAEIVIFPGVRYERWSGDAAQSERSPLKHHRDPMKIAE